MKTIILFEIKLSLIFCFNETTRNNCLDLVRRVSILHHYVFNLPNQSNKSTLCEMILLVALATNPCRIL